MFHTHPRFSGPSIGFQDMSTASADRHNWPLIAMLVHVACAAITSFSVPLLGGSNIFPIAGIGWTILTAPFAAVIGGLIGLRIQRHGGSMAIRTLFASAALTSAAIIAIILANW